MRVRESKQKILESLGDMDNQQTEKVLEYIRSLLMTQKEREDYLRFKETGLQQIKSALKEG